MRKKAAIRIAITTTAIALIVVHVRYPGMLPSDPITIGLLIVALLPWLIEIIEQAEFPGGWKISFREIEKETETLRRITTETRHRLDRLIVSSLSPRLRREIEDFEQGRGGQIDLTDAYLRELSHLHNMGMLQFRDGCSGFDSMPRPPNRVDDILKYLEITPLGREYLALARAVQEKEE